MEPASTVTDGIRVSVRTAYIEDDSSPRHHHFVFAYQVDIENESDEEVQLISREWHIVNGHGVEKVVEGQGVIGKQPVIKPEEGYRYVSSTHFSTSVGKMWGYYHMRRIADGSEIKVRIPDFSMTVPYALN